MIPVPDTFTHCDCQEWQSGQTPLGGQRNRPHPEHCWARSSWPLAASQKGLVSESTIGRGLVADMVTPYEGGESCRLLLHNTARFLGRGPADRWRDQMSARH